MFLRPRSLHARLAKLLWKLGCSRSAPAAPHEAARLSQELTLWPCLLSQRRCRMPQAFTASRFCLRCIIACMLATRLAPPLPSTARQRVGTRQDRRCAFPALVLLVPTPKGVRRHLAIVLLLSLEGSEKRKPEPTRIFPEITFRVASRKKKNSWLCPTGLCILLIDLGRLNCNDRRAFCSLSFQTSRAQQSWRCVAA